MCVTCNFLDVLLCSLRSSHPVVFLGKGVLKICSKLTAEQPCQSLTSIRLLSNFIEITLPHGCSPVNCFPGCFPKNSSGWLLLLSLTHFSWGRVNFTLPKNFLILKNYGRPGLPRFFRESNLVLKIFWKFQVNSMPISTLMTVLWGDFTQCFLKQNFLYYYKNHRKNNKHKS